MRKIPTLFVRQAKYPRYITDHVAPGCEWVLDGEGVATWKIDGTALRLSVDGRWWARRAWNTGKSYPADFVPVELDRATQKVFGWEPIEQSPFYKFFQEAVPPDEPGTYELIGPRINGNPENVSKSIIMRHGIEIDSITDRSYEGLRTWCFSNPDIEGIVFWRTPGDLSGDMAKVKLRDFPHE